MKNIISYYYNFALNDLSITYDGKIYRFELEGNSFAFLEIHRPVEEIEQLQLLLQNTNKYYKIILNRENGVVTATNNKFYILILLHNRTMEEDLYRYSFINMPLDQIERLLRNRWGELWSSKIDYFEYQLPHIEMKFPIIRDSVHYYIGLAEVAIAYVKETEGLVPKDRVDHLVVSHKRIDFSDFAYYNPLNLVVDHKARDISEYLKKIFLEDDYTIEEIEQIIRRLDFSEYGFRLLMGRMLFPSFYFDLYEDIINSEQDEKLLVPILKRVTEYEQYLKMIYYYISIKIKIPKVDFL